MHLISRLARNGGANSDGASDQRNPSGVSNLAAFLEGYSPVSPRVPVEKLTKATEMKDTPDAMPFAGELPPQLSDAKPKTEAEKLLLRVRVTLKCRYNASVRLRRYYRFCLFTSMAFAVGLIVIPLLQNSSIPLAFSTSVMDMMQVLLAVGMLVFTVIIGKAGYELRADRLNQEGDALKEMSRRLSRHISSNANMRLDEYHHEYAVLTTGKEGHSRADYLQARLEMQEDYPRWLGNRLLLGCVSVVATFYSYIIPVAFILMEAAFIADMLNLTSFYPHVLHAAVGPHL